MTGTGSHLSAGILEVGNFGTGNLHVEAGGSVTSQATTIGVYGEGHAEVTGTGSQWSITSGQFTVGGGGVGTLAIGDSAVVNSGFSSIGDVGGSTGTATVSGGQWNNSDALLVGNLGTGTLNLTGGKVSSTLTWLGATNGTGTLNIGTGTTAGVLDTAAVMTGAGTATLNFNHNQADYYFTRDGTAGGTAVVIDGTTTVNQVGTGRTTLTAANTYTGGTTIQGGILRLGASDTLQDATGLVSLTAGRLESAVANVNLGGGLSVNGGTLGVHGADVGTITLAQNESFDFLAGTAEFTFDDISSFDQILGDGGLFSITGGIFNLTGTVTDYGATYQLLDGFAGGSVSGLSFINYDSTHYLASLSNTGLLSFMAVPEPAAGSLLLGGLVALAALRRRQT